MGTPVMLVLILVVLSEVHSADKKYKICSLQGHEKDCTQVERNEDVYCVNNYHGIDCILNIEQGKTDFGRVTPEEALIAANFVSNVVVLGEFRSDAIHDDALYATMVLVRRDHTGGLKGLKGKKYCHPGFKFEEPVTELVLKEFERAVLKANNAEGCSNKVESDTLLEKELKALSDFFGPSCRPGPWIDLEDRNTKYYQQYSKLCELCISNDKCMMPSGVAPFMQSLDCLVNGGGDIALTTLNTVYEFFNRSENVNKKADYQYLCRDGSLASLDNPCTWSKQPWDLIIANKEKGEFIKNDLEQWLPRNVIQSGPTAFSGKTLFEESLEAILFPREKQYNKINFTHQLQSLNNYMKEYRAIPTVRDSEKCNQDLKWCTVSKEEQQKCLWLAQASINHGIQPVINCIQSPSKLACLEDIKKDKADVVTSDAHYGYIARRKNLASLAYPETNPKNRINTIVVIKDSNQLGIQRFENLKTRKACMPEYGGTEWLSFINTAREHGVLSKGTCDYGELISEFVGDSCMPGAHDSEHEKTAKTNDEKLCSLCVPVPDPSIAKTATTCNSDNTNKYYGNIGALECLKEIGDYAVITRDYAGINASDFNASDFRVLCKNGSLAGYTGFDVDPECVLSTIVDSEVVSKRDNPKNGDIGLALLNFERRFGTDRVKAFEVFNIFNNTQDLLFKDSTPGLDAVTSSNPYIKNYIDLIAHIDKCSADGNSSATATQAIDLPILLTLLLLLLTNRN